MSRAAAAFLLSCFVALLLTPAVGALVGAKGGGQALQNRALKPRPTPTWQSVWDGSFSTGMTDWLWDVLPWRDRLLVLDHRLDVGLWGDSPVPDKVVFGEAGFAFRVDRVSGHRAGAVDAARVIAAVDRIAAAAAATDRRLFIVVSPTKAALYPELLPTAHRLAYERSALPTLEALLRKGPPVVDLWTPLVQEKARLRDAVALAHPRLRTLYRPLDDHWSLETGLIQARVIVEAIDPGAWHGDRIVVDATGYKELESELSSIYLKTGQLEPYTTATLAGGVQLRRRQTSVPGTHAVLHVDNTSSGAFAPAAGDVVVIRDSFLSGLPTTPGYARDGGIEAIAASFTKTTFIHWDAIAAARTHDDAVRPHLRGRPVIVIQVTQANLTNLVAHEATFVRLLKDEPPPPPPRKGSPGKSPPKTPR